MAATPERSRERVSTDDPSSRFSSNFTALMLVFPGIVLYIYILYIIVTKMVYPASFLPFTQPPSSIEDIEEKDEIYLGFHHPLVGNALLLLLFGLQHSLMACQSLKGFFEDINLPVITRPVFICCTCFTINVINYLWQPLPTQQLWRIESHTLVLSFLCAHVLGWLSIACSVFTIDYLELLGIKQIYYSFYGFDNPILYKSSEQQLLLQHNRHPIFLAPVLILWAVPVMTYDRVLVAIMFALYMGLGAMVTRSDVQYILEQFAAKRSQLLSK